MRRQRVITSTEEPCEPQRSSVAGRPDAYRPLTRDSQPVSIQEEAEDTRRKGEAVGEEGRRRKEMKNCEEAREQYPPLKRIHNSLSVLSFFPVYFLPLSDGCTAGGLFIFKGD